MSGETTPAIERGAASGPMAYTQAMTDPEVPHVWRYVAGAVLTTALTDPDDSDSLARTLYVAYWAAQRVPAEEARRQWLVAIMPIRDRWRTVADGLRAALLGPTP